MIIFLHQDQMNSDKNPTEIRITWLWPWVIRYFIFCYRSKSLRRTKVLTMPYTVCLTPTQGTHFTRTMSLSIYRYFYALSNIDNINQTSPLPHTPIWAQTQSGPSRCFFEQKTLHSLLRTGWFQEWIWDCVCKLIATFVPMQSN